MLDIVYSILLCVRRCAVNATADGLNTATDAMDGFLSSVSGGMDCLPSYVEVCSYISSSGGRYSKQGELF